jgi:hypothetical protein
MILHVFIFLVQPSLHSHLVSHQILFQCSFLTFLDCLPKISSPPLIIQTSLPFNPKNHLFHVKILSFFLSRKSFRYVILILFF